MNFEHDADDDPAEATAEALQQIASQLKRLADSQQSEGYTVQRVDLGVDPMVQRMRAGVDESPEEVDGE